MDFNCIIIIYWIVLCLIKVLFGPAVEKSQLITRRVDGARDTGRTRHRAAGDSSGDKSYFID